MTRYINHATVDLFSNLYIRAPLTSMLENPPSHWDVEKLLNVFNSTCSDILDSVAPIRKISVRPKPQPWFNEVTQAFRRECRKAERRWKKNGLQVSLEIFKQSLSTYQSLVIEEKKKFLADAIAQNHHNPKFLFYTVNSVINSPKSGLIEESFELCENFQKKFYNKIKTIRSDTAKLNQDSLVVPLCSDYLTYFEPLSLATLTDIVGQMKPSNCPGDRTPS